MAKKLKNFRLSDEVVNLLALLAERESRSEANMIEVLVKEKAAALGITAGKS